jgi:2-polyprenyl-3-methyl-5-hydroxy-6-metoxy-1,4-benzoquinol methylase
MHLFLFHQMLALRSKAIIQINPTFIKRMKNFWNERYAQPGYTYGKQPNVFFKDEIDKLPAGSLMLPAEGEGRNAVYSAVRGWNVTAFDYSEEGKTKALKLALENNTSIEYLIADYQTVEFPENHFDALALIYAHSPEWETVYPRLLKFLKPGGALIVEIFSKKQIHNLSGGPKVLEMLLDAAELKSILSGFAKVNVWEETIELNESQYHQGKADVTRCIAVK